MKRGSNSQSFLDFNVEIDFEKLVGWKGASGFMDAYSTNGRPGTAYTGDFQVFSNIETDIAIDEIAELWYQQVFSGGMFRLKVGKVDANSEFNYVDAAGEFIHSSAGFSPTIFVFPSFPDPAMSLIAGFHPKDDVSFVLGVFDGAAGVDGVPTGRRGPSSFFSDRHSDDYFIIAEGNLTWDCNGYQGRGGLGGWYHTGDFATFAGGMQNGASGFYGTIEQQISKRASGDQAASNGGLYVFGQIGLADDDVSEVELHLGAGLTLQGTFSCRDDDSAGVYLSHVQLNEAAGYSQDETAVEVFYAIQVTPFARLKPDVQIIFNPGGVSTVDTAVVTTLRLELSF